MDPITIHVKGNHEPGTVVSLIRIAHQHGLLVVNHKVMTQDGHDDITIKCRGQITTNEDRLREAMERHPTVTNLRIILPENSIKIKQTQDQPTATIETTKAEEHSPKKKIPSGLLVTLEKLLSESMGPAANILVHEAAKNCSEDGDCSQLLKELSEELGTAKERQDFVAAVRKAYPDLS